eukprot:TRINITY_DN1379_c1_g2_i1.p1 TRINITY_DN1379_c1_g2~~TRINITY_DN1379_c1_g2_i1.p1  ORF type:complete len:986 (+),score=366.74 TRINITY_DN1379_c1_g2_i1:292-2958(+)
MEQVRHIQHLFGPTAPIVPTCAVQASGREALIQAIAALPAPASRGALRTTPPMLRILRSKEVTGRAVVVGALAHGQLCVGATVTLYPGVSAQPVRTQVVHISCEGTSVDTVACGVVAEVELAVAGELARDDGLVGQVAGSVGAGIHVHHTLLPVLGVSRARDEKGRKVKPLVAGEAVAITAGAARCSGVVASQDRASLSVALKTPLFTLPNERVGVWREEPHGIAAWGAVLNLAAPLPPPPQAAPEPSGALPRKEEKQVSFVAACEVVESESEAEEECEAPPQPPQQQPPAAAPPAVQYTFSEPGDHRTLAGSVAKAVGAGALPFTLSEPLAAVRGSGLGDPLYFTFTEPGERAPARPAPAAAAAAAGEGEAATEGDAAAEAAAAPPQEHLHRTLAAHHDASEGLLYTLSEPAFVGRSVDGGKPQCHPLQYTRSEPGERQGLYLRLNASLGDGPCDADAAAQPPAHTVRHDPYSETMPYLFNGPSGGDEAGRASPEAPGSSSPPQPDGGVQEEPTKKGRKRGRRRRRNGAAEDTPSSQSHSRPGSAAARSSAGSVGEGADAGQLMWPGDYGLDLDMGYVRSEDEKEDGLNLCRMVWGGGEVMSKRSERVPSRPLFGKGGIYSKAPQDSKANAQKDDKDAANGSGRDAATEDTCRRRDRKKQPPPPPLPPAPTHPTGPPSSDAAAAGRGERAAAAAAKHAAAANGQAANGTAVQRLLKQVFDSPAEGAEEAPRKGALRRRGVPAEEDAPEDEAYRALLITALNRMKGGGGAAVPAQFPPPEVVRVPGAAASRVVNFGAIAAALQRPPAHMRDYLAKELSVAATLESNAALVLHRVFKANSLEVVLRKYTLAFVRCTTCGGQTGVTRAEGGVLQLMCMHCRATRAQVNTL